MEPRFVDRGAFTVMGTMECIVDADTTDFGSIWERYMAYDDQVKPFSTDRAYYGCWFGTKEGALDYVAGMSVDATARATTGLTLRQVPAAHYAVFECTVSTIGQTYDEVFGWFPGSPYEQHGPNFELYPPDTTEKDAPVFLYFPIREKPKSAP